MYIHVNSVSCALKVSALYVCHILKKTIINLLWCNHDIFIITKFLLNLNWIQCTGPCSHSDLIAFDKCALLMELVWTAGSTCHRLPLLALGVKELPRPGGGCDRAASSSPLSHLFAHVKQYCFLCRHGGSGKHTSSQLKPLPWPPCRLSMTGSTPMLPSPMKSGMTLRLW